MPRARMLRRPLAKIAKVILSKGGSLLQLTLPASPKNVLLLHGQLDIWIKEAINLPNMDSFHKKLAGMVGMSSGKITSDPYVTVSVSRCIVARTFVIDNSENPVWMQHFFVPVAHSASELHFIVKDDDMVGSQIIGSIRIPVQQLYSGQMIQGTFPILNEEGKQWPSGASLSLSVQYYPVERMRLYNQGVGSGPEYNGVPGTYFPLRRGGNLKLYQDAHIEDGILPNCKLDHGILYEHGKCWRDIFQAICDARHLVYIVGWSVFHGVTLVRDAQTATDSELGHLLKSKAQEGVRVLLLVWDDPTSWRILGHHEGKLHTDDEVTRRFFKGSAVRVILCPRSGGKGHSLFGRTEAETIYTHHQKTVIVDSDAGQSRRKIIAFVGGLDLCGGRYDTPAHPLFRTLQTVHKGDYYNPNYKGSSDGCPRQPWHDLHCRIDGAAAYDVLDNFEDRWMRASKPGVIRKMVSSHRHHDDHLLKIDRIPNIMGLDEISSMQYCETEGWHIQVFRSIDSNSVTSFPKYPNDAKEKNLLCGKNVLIDMSIHTAYVHAIRAAQHFIYIENQYFLGSSYYWDSYKDRGANNLVPIEIAFKIANKIRAHQRFAAYVIVPMWPEGDPKGIPTQRILFCQYQTMQMMYGIIYKALEEVGLQDTYEPQDYLNFFCLGNREVNEGSCSGEVANIPQALSKKYRRFMIYVHSKGMIVDDEYLIIGSANINQRSMDGTRDSEIAMGAYQPHHAWARKQDHPYGQIYGYRMSLWAEHLGQLEDCYRSPESLECVRRVRAVGEANWLQFAAEEVTEMKSHLLKYPLDVDRRGKVKPLQGYETFPDFGGKIIGSFNGLNENLTI